ncbi:MAG: hypothetical protein Q9223_003724 [Gallowayella weberi]
MNMDMKKMNLYTYDLWTRDGVGELVWLATVVRQSESMKKSYSVSAVFISQSQLAARWVFDMASEHIHEEGVFKLHEVAIRSMSAAPAPLGLGTTSWAVEEHGHYHGDARANLTTGDSHVNEDSTLDREHQSPTITLDYSTRDLCNTTHYPTDISKLLQQGPVAKRIPGERNTRGCSSDKTGSDRTISPDRVLFVVDPTRKAGLEFEIVVGHYNEDLSWLKEKSDECCIYSKGGPDNAPAPPFKFTSLPNIGREGHTFLHHIVNNYDTLAEVTLFVQGRIDDHVDLTLSEMKQRALETSPGQVTTYPFRELELFDHWEGIPWEQYPCWKRWSSMECQKMKETPLQLFQEYVLMTDRVPVAVGFAPGAIFAVRKETIQQHSKAFYARLLNKMFLGEMAHVNPETGHYMERFWLAMFNPNEYVQWEASEVADSRRNSAGQLAKGHWYRTPTGSSIDLGAIRRGEEVDVDNPVSPISALASSPSIRSGSDTGLSVMTDDEKLEEK